MRRHFRFLAVLLSFLLSSGGFCTVVSAQFEEDSPKEVTYSFVASLSKAKAVRMKRGGQVYVGKWENESFRFANLPGLADIFASDNVVVDGKPHSVIWFPALSGFESSLTFSEVPPGKRLYLFFALPDSVFRQKKVVPVDFEVFLGKKRLLNTRILTRGVRQEAFDLTFPYLLHRPYRLTFRVRPAAAQSVDFVFYGYIE